MGRDTQSDVVKRIAGSDKVELGDLNRSDIAVIRLLDEGRVTPDYAASELDLTPQYAQRVLSNLVEDGVATRLVRGLYEIDWSEE